MSNGIVEIVHLASKTTYINVCNSYTYTYTILEEKRHPESIADAFYDTCLTQHRISVRHATTDPRQRTPVKEGHGGKFRGLINRSV